jgi:hypothetical protein
MPKTFNNKMASGHHFPYSITAPVPDAKNNHSSQLLTPRVLSDSKLQLLPYMTESLFYLTTVVCHLPLLRGLASGWVMFIDKQHVAAESCKIK